MIPHKSVAMLEVHGEDVGEDSVGGDLNDPPYRYYTPLALVRLPPRCYNFPWLLRWPSNNGCSSYPRHNLALALVPVLDLALVLG